MVERKKRSNIDVTRCERAGERGRADERTVANERADGGIHEVREIPPLAAIRDNAWVGKSHDKHPSLSPTSVETN